MNALEISLTVVSVATWASFAWAIAAFFKSPEGMQPGMKAISIGGNIGAVSQFVCLIFFQAATPSMQIAGIVVYLLAVALFWAAVWANRSKPLTLAYTNDQPEHLVQHGPYGLVRHPFYSAYTLAWIAGPVATAQWWLFVFVVGMFVLYHKAAVSEEQKFLNSELADAYQGYMKRTGRFFPFIG